MKTPGLIISCQNCGGLGRGNRLVEGSVFQKMAMAMQTKIYLVGTGPGDPDLLTVKAQRLLQTADVIVFDRLVSDAIVEQIPQGISRIYVGKESGRHPVPQEEINQLLAGLATGNNRTIVRLKGGDPFVFGRGSEEALYLAERGIPFEVVPGITAAVACTAYAGIPLTHRGMSRGVHIVTGHCLENEPLELDWQKLADPERTIVVYMGLANLERICRKLIEAGLSPQTPAAVIENGTTLQQRQCVASLVHLPAQVLQYKMKAPVMIVIGRVVSLADKLDWFISSLAEQNGSLPKEHGANA